MILWDTGQNIRPRLRPEGIGTGGNHQGVIAVGLDEVEEGVNVLRPQAGGKQNVAAPVLIHVPEVPVPLGVVLPAQGEGVVLPLGVSVLPGIEVEGDAFPTVLKEHGCTAPQGVVQVGLAAVGVKHRVGRAAGDRGAQLLHQSGGLTAFSLKPVPSGDPPGQRGHSPLVLCLTVEGIHPQFLPRPQRGLLGQEAAGETVLRLLGSGPKVRQRGGGKALRHGQGRICPKHQLRLDQRAQRRSPLVPGQAEITALHPADLGGVLHGGPHPEAGHAGIRVLHPHPGLGQIVHLLEVFVADAIWN